MTSNLVTPLNNKNKVEDLLDGYWKSDIWEVEEFPYKERLGKTSDRKALDFSFLNNVYIKSEFKYYGMFGFKNEWWLLSTFIYQHFPYLKFFVLFLESVYPRIKSVREVYHDELFANYKRHLVQIGKPLIMVRDGKKRTSYYINFAKAYYRFFDDFYDERPEHEKDRWNIERLGIPYNMSRRDKFISFENIKQPFRELVKKYIYQNLLVQQSITHATAQNILKKMYLFFDYIVDEYPLWNDLNALTRKDIEGFLFYVRNTDMGGRSHAKNRTPSNRHILESISNVKRLIEHMQDYEWREAPTIPVHMLIYPDDYPKRKHKIYEDHIKHVPDYVWEQVQENLHKLDSEIARIVILMEASGFRISDVCQLQIDCLLYKHDGWWLVGDQQKVNMEEHIVPISEEIVSIVKLQREVIEPNSTNENNPNHFLFPVLKGKNKGKAFSQRRVKNALNRLASDCHILDRNGSVFHFKNHAFRHRYGMNLLNNGMSILHVQKLMAHTGPEMTLTYARILDSTLRKEWEKVQNAIRIDNEGGIVQADLSEQAEENGLELEWIRHNMDSIRLDHGFCIKSPKLSCDFLEQTLEPPCIKNNCRSFHVDSTFLDYYNDQILKMETDIEIYDKTGRTRSVELIQPKLKKFKEIRNSIKEGTGILGTQKNKREYVGNERDSNG
ncbi:Site-specific recombinase XerD [Gracilibacillus orientalis]|uniref:Site-specific recombinase XerD n=1 Tax=Gracilibacillus orientalis TaxID=334253 RepID=A0A1I4MI21_9BACI|nr:tyrosine-type recombinase/integrase [Gracilibacillus orientalis]SFM02693.1 Site-specific recombinase XerD [Gracilibacillus orientalis]